MNPETVLIGAIAVAVACLVIVTRSALRYFGKEDAVAKYDRYMPYAVMAAKWVENQIPDDYGAAQEDPGTARAVHKLDLFLARFVQNVETFTGDKADEELKAAAMKWSVELAERVGKK